MQSSTEGVDCSNLDVFKELMDVQCDWLELCVEIHGDEICCFHYTEIEMCALLTCPEVERLWTCQPTGHQLQEGAEGVEDPGAEEVDDLGTHDVGQCGVLLEQYTCNSGFSGIVLLV